MSLFSKLFKSHVGDESKATIELLSKWEKTHFQLYNTRYSSSSGTNDNGSSCYITYRRDTGETISLSGMVVHQEKQDKPKGFFGKMKEIIDPAPRLTVPSTDKSAISNILYVINTPIAIIPHIIPWETAPGIALKSADISTFMSSNYRIMKLLHIQMASEYQALRCHQDKQCMCVQASKEKFDCYSQMQEVS